MNVSVDKSLFPCVFTSAKHYYISNSIAIIFNKIVIKY